MPSTRRLTPDNYAAIAMVSAAVGEVFLPLTLLPQASISTPASWAGGIVALLGLALEIGVARRLAQAGTTTRPHAAPTALVTSGPFRASRNPFYLGLLLVLGGLMLMLGMDWLILAIPLTWLALDRLVVPHEEQALATAFPAEWQAYAARVRRWL